MIEKRDIRVGCFFSHRDLRITMRVVSFESGHESHLGLITLRLGGFTWTGSFRRFQTEFTVPGSVSQESLF